MTDFACSRPPHAVSDDTWNQYHSVVGSEVAAVTRHQPSHLRSEVEDLTQEAWIAVLDALATYDVAQNIPASAYVRVKVRFALKQVQRRSDPLSESVRRDLRAVNAEQQHGCDEQRGRRGADQVARLQHLSAQRLADLQRQHAAATQSELLEAAEQEEQHLFPSPEQWLISTEQRVSLYRALKLLPERERDVLRMRYLEERPIAEVAEHFGITAGRVSQVAASAIRHLRQHLQRWGA